MQRWASSRRQFLIQAGRLAGAAAGLGSAAGALTRRAEAAVRAVTENSTVTYDFAAAADRASWGAKWLALHYLRPADVLDGWARFSVPDGLSTTAPAQPMPIFLLDHDAGSGVQRMVFKVSNPRLRPGLLFSGLPPFSYVAVTVEDDQLVLASYRRTTRDVLTRAPVAPLRAGAVYHLSVAWADGRVRAKLWEGESVPRDPQIDTSLSRRQLGCFGVLCVHPTDLGSGELSVGRYYLEVPGSFAPTPPRSLFTISGIPSDGDGGSASVRLRAASVLPVAVRFEWSENADHSGSVTSAESIASAPPYAGAKTVSIAGRSLYWRARFRSLSSNAQASSAWQEVTRHDPAGPLVLAAASCAHVWGKPSYYGLTNARQAADGRLRALIYQGDLGYANNNTSGSGYFAAEDFFADRFTRFLSDPEFTSLRATSSGAFTLDDHDYGPPNDTSAAGVERWAIDLWNRMHADPTNVGYFDFRFGDVQCLALDVRRYADPPSQDATAPISRLGAEQFSWMESIVTGSDAEAFLLFSAGIFASRITLDCFLFGWTKEYLRALTLFHGVQAGGKRVVVLSGDAHGLRIHYHPDPQGRATTSGIPVVEFVCSGLQAKTWSPAVEGDQTLDQARSVMRRSGLGLVTIDPAGTSARRITLRALAAAKTSTPVDLFAPLVLPFRPAAVAGTAGVEVPIHVRVRNTPQE